MTEDQPEPGSPPDPNADAVDPAMTYEDARDELIAVVQQLETGGVSLEDSVVLWERGEQLAAICQRWLDGARARLDAAMDRKDG